MESLNQVDALRSLPSVEIVLEVLQTVPGASALPHELVVGTIRRIIQQARNEIRAGTIQACSLDDIVHDVLLSLQSHFSASLRPVINATGIIIHTNLGRSALAQSAIDAVVDVSRGYSTLEYDVHEMARGSRHDHCESLLCALTGAEAAIAVNNNAAAVMLVLSEFAAGHEAIISRGELIEIGGSFRIPDIMETSNATMVEVGTTNKTHLTDYENAITAQTALLLKVHTSNYRVVGFTETVSAKQLKDLAQKSNASRMPDQNPLLVYEDLGSGMLVPLDGLEEYGEPTVAQVVAQGCDLVSFSGDKLLGGPQAGIVVGSKALIGRLKKNPLVRALRLDKMTLAALEATLRLYLNPDQAQNSIPTLRMLSTPMNELQIQAQSLREKLEQVVPAQAGSVSVVESVARAGGGALPMFDIPSYAVALEFQRGCAQACMEFLVQKHSIPIIARISHEQLLFDVRTVLYEEELREIVHGVNAYFITLTS